MEGKGCEVNYSPYLGTCGEEGCGDSILLLNAKLVIHYFIPTNCVRNV
jgi:hypothetical protein